MSPEASGNSPNQEKEKSVDRNWRPLSSKRVTFALGQPGKDQADRLARALSSYCKGGVSQSAVVRGLLKIAERAALDSGDPAVAPVFTGPDTPRVSSNPNPEAVKLWEMIRSEIAGDRDSG